MGRYGLVIMVVLQVVVGFRTVSNANQIRATVYDNDGNKWEIRKVSGTPYKEYFGPLCGFSSNGIRLASGVVVEYSKIKAVSIRTSYPSTYANITLRESGQIKGKISFFSYLTGEYDLGKFDMQARDIRRIVFTHDESALSGKPRCTLCQQKFPEDYNYCPYCGKMLQKDTSLPAKDIITNSVGMKLKYIPPGEFWMGSSENEKGHQDNESPKHLVKLTKGFYMGVTEVTQAQWLKVIRSRPWSGKDNVREGDSYPATYVSWDDAVEFCKKLSQKEGRKYRLPTEAEWEYACRAGTKTAYSFGDDDSRLGDYEWFTNNTYHVDQKYAHTVAQKKPNPWGLFDVHGNVWEWCGDWYGEKTYPTRQTTDPKGPPGGKYRVLRGGAWNFHPEDCRSAYRGGYTPDTRNLHSGFRIVIDSNFGQIYPTESSISVSQPKSRDKRQEQASCSLTVVVTTPLLQVFSLKEHDLTVSIDGPVSRTRIEKSVATAMAKSFVFGGVPKGEYTITAKYGKKTIKKKVNVSGDTYEFQMTF